jgi:hypothetical protein
MGWVMRDPHSIEYRNEARVKSSTSRLVVEDLWFKDR